jgi:hypothetical protein
VFSIDPLCKIAPRPSDFVSLEADELRGRERKLLEPISSRPRRQKSLQTKPLIYIDILFLLRLHVCVHNPPCMIAGWSSLVARKAHNLEVVGSNPTPATNNRVAAVFVFVTGGYGRSPLSPVVTLSSAPILGSRKNERSSGGMKPPRKAMPLSRASATCHAKARHSRIVSEHHRLFLNLAYAESVAAGLG